MGKSEVVELKNPKKIEKYLSYIVDELNGNVNVDYYSYFSYDHISSVEKVEDNIFKIFWKNIDVHQHDREIFNYDYMYSLVKINKIILNRKSYIKADLLKRKEIIRILEVDEDNCHIDSDPSQLFSEFIFYDSNNKSHACIVCDMPFFSLCICGKGQSFSRSELYQLNMSEIILRYEKIEKKIKKDLLDEDDIEAAGNTLRKILERTFKLYIILKNYHSITSKKNENIYDRLALGNLTDILSNNDDGINELISDKMRNLANKFSHDSGDSRTIDELEKLAVYTKDIISHIITKTVELM